MARKKVNLAWIQKDSARRATYKKRKRGLLKKVSELSTLCGIRACAIVFGPSETTPEIWPPTTAAVQQIIQTFNDLPQVEKSKKMLNQEGFLRQRISKLKEQFAKLTKENRELELKTKLIKGMQDKSVLNGVGIEELHTLACLVESKLAKVRGRNEQMMSNGPALLTHSTQLPPQMTTLPPFPSMQLREEERELLHHGAVGMDHAYQENNCMVDFLVNLENYPIEWPYGDNINWNYPGPQL